MNNRPSPKRSRSIARRARAGAVHAAVGRAECSAHSAGNSMVRRIGRDEWKARLRAERPIVLPSLLACDFGHLEREIRRVEEAGAGAAPGRDGRPFRAELQHRHSDRRGGSPGHRSAAGRAPDDRATGAVCRAVSDAGADGLTIHVEAVPDPRPVLEKIRSLGAWAGLALNPPTPLSAIERSLPYCDLVLVMSVMPGFGGQKFDETVLPKLRELQCPRRLRCAAGSRRRNRCGDDWPVCGSRCGAVRGGHGRFSKRRLRGDDSPIAIARGPGAMRHANQTTRANSNPGLTVSRRV